MRYVFLIGVLLLVGCGGKDFYSEGTATTRDDAVILKTIQRAFWEHDGIDEDDLYIRVDRRDVSVSGRVSNTEEKQRILDVLRATDGVDDININGLTRG